MYLVTGVTGHTGGTAASILLDHRVPVRVLVHHEDKAQAWRARGAEVVVGSLEDPSVIERALQGVHGAWVLMPPRYPQPGLLEFHARVADAIARAVKASGVPHVVLLSSVGGELPEGTGPITGLHRAEQTIGSAAPGFTALRAAYFVENWAAMLGQVTSNAVLPSFLTPGAALDMVATRDIGRAAADLLLEGPNDHQVVDLLGPRPWTPEDIAAQLSAAMGRDVRVQPAPLDALVPVLTSIGMDAGNAGLIREMIEALNDGRVTPQRAGVIRFGTLTPQEVLAPMLAAVPA